MKIKQRTEVSMVTHEVTVVRVQAVPAFCRECGAVSPQLSVDEAVAVLAMTESVVRRLVETGHLHHRSASDGSIEICGNSVSELEETGSNKEEK